jgi:hypothetical protein
MKIIAIQRSIIRVGIARGDQCHQALELVQDW